MKPAKVSLSPVFVAVAEVPLVVPLVVSNPVAVSTPAEKVEATKIASPPATYAHIFSAKRFIVLQKAEEQVNEFVGQNSDFAMV